MSKVARLLAVLLSVTMTVTSVTASTCKICCSRRFDSHCAGVRSSAKVKTDANAVSHHCATMLGDRDNRDSARRSMAASMAMATTRDPALFPAIVRPELEPVTANLRCHRDACGEASSLAVTSPSIQVPTFEGSVSAQSAPLLLRFFYEQRHAIRTVLEPATAPLALRI
jgi:hypothetical protein